MRRVFVDSGAFVAMRNRSEREHEITRRAFASLVAERVALFTSNFVVAETYAALLVRVGGDEARRWGRLVRNGSFVDVVRVDEEVEDAAWSILESHADKSWSYVDATSFALMDREGAVEALALDHNFAQRGLHVLPDHAG